MDHPYFSIIEYGVFDSNVKFPKIVETKSRQVEDFELELFTSDCPGQAYLSGHWHPLKHGTFICAKPGIRRKSRLPYKCHYIHLSTQDPALTGLLQSLPDVFTIWQLQEPVQIFHEMLTVESSDILEDRLLLESCVCRLLRLLSRYRLITERQKINNNISIHQKALLTVEQYIRENIRRDLPLSELAKICSLSPTYFHSIFTEFFQKTPAQYILECRISAAKTGLITGDYSLTKLAADCGFSSQSYFCYKFKQVTGKTPLQYRKEMLGRLTP